MPVLTKVMGMTKLSRLTRVLMKMMWTQKRRLIFWMRRRVGWVWMRVERGRRMVKRESKVKSRVLLAVVGLELLCMRTEMETQWTGR